jgi:hypothetical protein
MMIQQDAIWSDVTVNTKNKGIIAYLCLLLMFVGIGGASRW